MSDLIVPAYLLVPEYDYTFGPQVAEVCAAANFAPDPEQELILNAAFGERNGLPASREGLLVGPRQNYKSAVLEMIQLGWMFVTCEPGSVWSAHQHKTVRGSFDHLCGLIESTPSLRRYLAKDPIESAGDEAIILRDPDGTERYFPFATRSGRGYRGRSFGKHIHDEYLYMLKGHEGALFPTQSTFVDWQRIGATSAGLPESDRARALRDRGRPMDRQAEPNFLYFETCDDLPGECVLGADCSHTYGIEGCIYDDPKRWARANYAVARERITLGYIAGERRSLDADEFGRERLGRWDEPAATMMPTFDAEVWRARTDVVSRIESDFVLVLEVASDRSWSTIVAVGRNTDGLVHAEVTSVQPDPEKPRVYDRRVSTAWLPARFRQLVDFLGGEATVLVRRRAPAESLAPTLLKIPGLKVEFLPDADYPLACGHLVDLVTGEQIVHVGDPELAAAVELLRQKFIGDKTFVWAKAAGDISPAVAMTAGAYWLHTQSQTSVYEERGPLWF